jgi:4,5-DOPA dioxygenase extradiol
MTGVGSGTWTVVRHIYADANIPVLPLSIDYHYVLSRELMTLRKKGVRTIGSGNMVHNLRMAAWNKLSELAYGIAWLSKQMSSSNN